MQLTIHAQTDYEIEFVQNLLASDTLVNYCKKLASQIVIITDDTVGTYYGAKIKSLLLTTHLPVHLLTFSAGEHYKSRDTKAQLEDEMLALKCTRDTCIIALGGGIVTDVVGFLAATYMRGVPVIYIPTTLLAMVDASIGGKTGVNTKWGKNLIGTFTQPRRVYIDVDFLDTLPKEEFNNGLVEVIKHALISDKSLFTALAADKISLYDKAQLQHIIYRSCDLKRQVVEQDPEEQNIRQLLNFGHTVGHAIEAASDYQIRHGEAVAIGMIVESHLSAQLGVLKPLVVDEITQILRFYDLPLTLPKSLQQDKFLDYFKMDKKNINQKIYCVLLEDIGQPFVPEGRYAHVIDNEMLKQEIEWLFKFFN